MKKTAFGLAAIVGLSILLTDCTAKTETSKQETPLLGATIYKDTVHLSTAQQNIGNYVYNCDKYLEDTVPIRSYTINKSDLFGILGVTTVPDCQYEHCRVYLGMDSYSNFKLYMTPTVKGPNPAGTGDSIYLDKIPYDRVNRKYFVYDLNAPCPSTCDQTSPLYMSAK